MTQGHQSQLTVGSVAGPQSEGGREGGSLERVDKTAENPSDETIRELVERERTRGGTDKRGNGQEGKRKRGDEKTNRIRQRV